MSLTILDEILPERVLVKKNRIPKESRKNKGHTQQACLPNNYVKRVAHSKSVVTMDDVKNRTYVRTSLSKSNRALDKKLGGEIEYRRMVENYNDVVRVLGTEFPFHPSYLNVLDVVCKYYRIPCLDVLTYPATVYHIKTNSNGAPFYPSSLQRAMLAYQCLCHLFIDVFKFSVVVVADVFSTDTRTVQLAAMRYEKKLSVRVNTIEYAQIISNINDVL